MRKALQLIALLAALALVAAACGSGDSDTTTTSSPPTTADVGTDTTTTLPPEPGVKFDVGVTEEPCTDGNPSRGCIILGSVTDQTSTFAAASPGLLAGHRLFWARVNASGGIGGEFDVEIRDEYIVNNNYDPATHVEVYQTIADEILALAESLGTPQSLAALPSYVEDNMVAAPASWWSGWAFSESDGGLIMESGASYCVEAMNAVDFSVGAVAPSTVGIIHFPTAYGEDYARGVELAAEANNLEVLFKQSTLPIALDPEQTEAVNTLVGNSADVTFLVTGPFENATIVGKAAAAGHQKPLIGAAPTWNVALLQSAAAPAFESGLYFASGQYPPWDYDSAGHAALRAAAEAAEVPPSTFVVFGWALQYPLKAALDQAHANGDLTREGLKNAAASLGEVDSEGMAPTVADFGGDPVVTQSMVAAVDSSAPDGLSVAQDFFTGPSAAGYSFTEACAG